MGQQMSEFGATASTEPAGASVTETPEPNETANWNTQFDETGAEQAQPDTEVAQPETSEQQQPETETQVPEEQTPEGELSREELEGQIAFYESLLADQFDPSMAGLPQQQQQQQQPQQEQPAPEMFEPRAFTPDPARIQKVLADGDADEFMALMAEQAEVITHNTRIEQAQVVQRGIEYAMPIHMASAKFYERNPELMGLRNVVERTMWEIRAQQPAANEMQLLRATEVALKPMISKAKTIAAQHKQKRQGGAQKNLATPPSGAGQTPPPHGRATPTEPKGATDAASRLQQLRAKAAQSRY